MSEMPAQAGMPFASQPELLDSFANVLDLHIFYLYKYHAWIGPDSSLKNMMGVVISREEFEHQLLRAADSVAFASLPDEEQRELAELREFFFSRVRATLESGEVIPLLELAYTFHADEFQLSVMATLLCCELNRKYEKLFAYLQDDITKKQPLAETLIRLFARPGELISSYYRYFSPDGILVKYLCGGEGRISAMTLSLRAPVRDFLLGGGEKYGERFTLEQPLMSPVIHKDLLGCVTTAARMSDEGKCTLIFLTGKSGSGRRFLVKHTAKALGTEVLFLRAQELCEAESVEWALADAVCDCVLHSATLCLTDFEVLLAEENPSKLSEFTHALTRCRAHLGEYFFITSTERWSEARLCEQIVKTDFELPETDEAMRLALWENFLRGRRFAEVIDPQEMAAKFRFTAGQIAAAVQRSEDLARLSGESAVSTELLHRSCYDQVVVGLNTLATPIKPAYGWDDLVLPPQEVQLLKEACAHVKYRHTVYTRWGFSKRAAYGRGLSMLFSGPPGTGKTMAAQVVTNQLHMQLYKIQLSQIVSKYIGETEKNLRQVFTEAKEANCILFFDEMDALFGKRSEVKDSHDRHANIETAYLLQQMEEYDGVVLMATNLLQNIDEAFMRRIQFVISFPFPDVPTRKLLWSKMLDTGAPLSDDVDLDFLAENFKMAGGNIKNCAVHAAFLAAGEGSEISMRHLVLGVVREQRKNNVVILKEDLKEYADLVF